MQGISTRNRNRRALQNHFGWVAAPQRERRPYLRPSSRIIAAGILMTALPRR